MNFQTAAFMLKRQMEASGKFFLVNGTTTFTELEKFGRSWMMVEFRALTGFNETICIETSDLDLVTEFFNNLKPLIEPEEWQTVISCQRVEVFGNHSLWLSGMPDDPSTPTLAETFGLT